MRVTPVFNLRWSAGLTCRTDSGSLCHPFRPGAHVSLDSDTPYNLPLCVFRLCVGSCLRLRTRPRHSCRSPFWWQTLLDSKPSFFSSCSLLIKKKNESKTNLGPFMFTPVLNPDDPKRRKPLVHEGFRCPVCPHIVPCLPFAWAGRWVR